MSIRALAKLWYWLPVIWYDQDWDYDYLLVIIKHKLLSMEHFFASGRPIVAGAPKDSKRIREMIQLVDRIREDDPLGDADAAIKLLCERLPQIREWWE